METVRTEVQGRKVILLNGARAEEKKIGTAVEIEAPEQLREASRKDPDAVAFGYMSGRWVAAA